MKISSATTLASGVAAAALLWATPALAQIQPSPTDGPIETQPAPPTQGFDDFPEDEIVVTGIRASIQRGLDVKRNSDSIVDAISAEELGKFPDVNVAESLQRITGVAITRARGGEGQFVTVRGLGEEFNAVTFNNRLIATENAGREFSFDVIAAELINAAEVFKTPTAAQGDGSIGGRVNVISAKPFDNIGFNAAASAALQYEGLDGSWGPRLSGVVSNTFGAGNEFGVLASLSYSERDIRTDVAESIFIQTNESVLGNSIVPAGTPGAVGGNRLNSFAASVAQTEQERLGGTLAFQWAPDDETVVTLDGLYSSLERPSEVFGYSYFPLGDGVIDGSVVVNDSNQITAADVILPNAAEVVGRRNAADTETFAIGLNLDRDFGTDWNFQGDISWSRADGVRDNVGSADGSGAFYVLGWPDGTFSQTAVGNRVPDITYTGAETPGAQQQQLADLTAQDVRLHFARNTSSSIEDEIFSLRGDVTKAIGERSALRVGLDYTSREKGNERFDNTATQCAFCGYATSLADVAPELVQGFFGEFNDDFLGSTDADIPRRIPTFSLDAFEQAYVFAAQRGLGPQGQSALTPVFNPAASNVVDESVLGGYVQADLEGVLGATPFSANAGVRFAYTDLTSTGAGASIQSVTILDTNNQNFVTTTAPREIDNDYFDVLPSFNVSFDIEENLVARAAFSRTLTRPTLTDLSTFFDLTSTNIGGEQIVAGNPELEAVRSNNVDATLEWYGDNGLSLTGAVYYKDISDFITNQNIRQDIVIPQGFDASGDVVIDQGQVTRSVLISTPLNGDSAEIYGIELAGLYTHPSGFGVQGNITLTDSSADFGDETADFENVSDVSYNASVFYENYGLQARAALNHRGDFLATTAGEGGLREIVDDFTQVDLSLSYDVTEAFTVFGEGQNVFNEQFFRFSETPDLVETFEDNGARWVLGVRATY